MVEPDNIVLEHSRHIRGAADALKREVAHVLSERADHVSSRLERVENRLGLTDA